MQMITIKELLSGNTLDKLPNDHQLNIEDLRVKMNLVRTAYNKVMIITSGYRTLEHHKAIYLARGVTNPPLGSKHLSGQACDVSDPDGSLMVWVKANVPLMESIGLWMEEADAQKRVHFQTLAPKSQKRFFFP